MTAITLLFTSHSAVAQDWSGWYGGLSLGGYSSTADETETIFLNGNEVHNSYVGNGLTYGLYTGHNWQQDKLIYGVEIGLRTGEMVDLHVNADSYEFAQRGMLDMKTRMGYLVRENTQVFVSAGLALGSLKYDWTAAGAHDTGTVRTKGYSIGLGVERLVGTNGILRMGMDYTQRSSNKFSSPLFPGSSWDVDTESLAVSIGYAVFLER